MEESQPKFVSFREVVSREEVHLPGGLRAGTHRDGFLIVYPAGRNYCAAFEEIKNRKVFGASLQRKGLSPFGMELISDDDGFESVRWRFFEGGSEHASDLWSGIAYAAHKQEDQQLSDVARKISFSLRASILRLRDVSREYYRQNLKVSFQNVNSERRFSNTEALELYISLHSAFVEMCATRDYLARFLASHLFRAPEISTMSTLLREIKKNRTGALAEEICRICDAKNTEGWMARLGRYRDLVVHEAPIQNLSEQKHLFARPTGISGGHVLKIYVPIPLDPILSLNSNYDDALEILRVFMIKLCSFAKLVAQSSGVQPEYLTITDDDVL